MLHIWMNMFTDTAICNSARQVRLAAFVDRTGLFAAIFYASEAPMNPRHYIHSLPFLAEQLNSGNVNIKVLLILS